MGVSITKRNVLGSDISLSELNLTANSIVYIDSNGDAIELTLGANGTLLTSAGATSAPTFTAAGA